VPLAKQLLSGAEGNRRQQVTLEAALEYVQAYPYPFVYVLVGIVLAMIALLLAALLLGRRLGQLEARGSLHKQERLARNDAVKRSRAVLTGQIAEQLAPFLPDFPGDAADARFLGKPVDYIVFDGLSGGLPLSVSFIEIKTGKSSLTPAEKAIKEAVLAGRVYWREYRIPEG